MAKPWEEKKRKRLERFAKMITDNPVFKGRPVGSRRVMPEIYDQDDYETLQTVAEICAIQDVLDRPV